MEIYVPKLKIVSDLKIENAYKKNHYEYQRELEDVLVLSLLDTKVHTVHNVGRHVKFIKQQFSLQSMSDYEKVKDVLWKQHRNAQYVGNAEIVDIHGVFYTRSWSKVKIASSTQAVGMLFWLDFDAKAKASNVLTLMIGQHAHFNKNAQSLRRRIQQEMKPHMSRFALLRTHEKRGSDVSDDLLATTRKLAETRTELLYKHGIKAALEIVDLTSNILLLEPRSMGLSAHMLERNGMAFVFDFLRYIAACTNVNVFEHAIDLAMHKAVDDPMAAPKHIFQYLKNENPFNSKTIQALMKRTELDPNYT